MEREPPKHYSVNAPFHNPGDSSEGAAGETSPLLGDKEQTPEHVLTSSKTRRNWRTIFLVIVLWVACVFASAAFSMIGPFFPKEAAKKGCSVLVVGIIVSAAPLCVFTTSPIFGYLLPKLGIRFSMLFGLALVGVAYTLMGFLQDVDKEWMFTGFAIGLRMTEGVGSSLTFTAMYTLLPELFPNRVSLLMGVFEVGSGLGFAIGPPIGGLLYTVGGFLAPFVTVGGLVLLIIPVVFLLYKKTSFQPKIIAFRVICRLSSNFMFVILLISQVVCLAALGFFNPTFQPFLNHQFGLNELQVGLVFVCGPAMYLILAAVFGALADRYGTRIFIVPGFVISGVAYFLIGPAYFISTPKLWLTIVASILMGIGLAPAFVPSYADLLNIAKTQHPEEDTEVLTGVVSGLTSAMLSLGYIARSLGKRVIKEVVKPIIVPVWEFIGPLLGASITQLTDFQTSSMLLGQVLIAQAILIFGATLIDKIFKCRQSS